MSLVPSRDTPPSRMPILPLPTIVIVPGAWHSPSHYLELTSRLGIAGFETVCLFAPSLNPADPQTADVATDAAFIREKALLSLIQQSKDILLVMHSYGGSPGSAAAKGRSKSECHCRGHRGGIVGFVYISALLADEGISMLSAIGGTWHPYMSANAETGYLTVTDTLTPFYADIPPALVSTTIATLLPHSLHCLMSPSPPPAWKDPVYAGRRFYIRCCNDNALTREGQDAMMELTGVTWATRDIATGHSPFLSRPEELTECLVGIVEEVNCGKSWFEDTERI